MKSFTIYERRLRHGVELRNVIELFPWNWLNSVPFTGVSEHTEEDGEAFDEAFELFHFENGKNSVKSPETLRKTAEIKGQRLWNGTIRVKVWIFREIASH